MTSLLANEDHEAVLFSRADAALYETKHHGRNTVVAFNGASEIVPSVPRERTGTVRRMIREGGVKAVFQPVWDLRHHTIITYEAPAHPIPDYGFNGPAEAFEIAAHIGESANLDALCRRVIFAQASHLPEGAFLFLNISPASLEDPAFSLALSTMMR